MSVETQSLDQTEGDDRRDAMAKRVAFDGLVEVGGALEEAFEAQALDVSLEGIHLRTAYLPDVGQPLTCRFDAGGKEVLASGSVVWRHEESRGGEFAVRFSELDQASREALTLAVDPGAMRTLQDPGSRVRLHIDGLGSPMRARVKGASHAELTVGSELGFLQVGKQLDLEDASTGSKRPATIDKVLVEVDPVSRIPQLVVTLRYSDTAESEPAPGLVGDSPAKSCEKSSKPLLKADGTPEPSVIDEEDAGGRRAKEATTDGSKSGVGSRFSGVAPAVVRLAKRAAVTLALLAERVRGTVPASSPARRTTAAAPGGGLHAEGRRVVRSHPALDIAPASLPLWRNKRALAFAAALACAFVLACLALRKPSASQASVAVATEAAPPQVAAPPSVPTAASPPEPAVAAEPSTPVLAHDPAPPPAVSETEHGRSKPGRVAPFGNGPVGHGNLLHIKMDGPIEKIEGASTPTGFTVVIPNRRSLEAAAPLASRDGRIATMRVTNEAHGAELAVTFKDGVPNYQVRAKGDTLEIALAAAGRASESSGGARPLLKPVANKTRRLKAIER